MPNNIEGVIPHLVVDDAAAALEFYRRALGAEEVMRMPADDGKRLLHAEIKVGAARIFLRDAFPEFCESGDDRTPATLGGTPVTLHLFVPDCDAAVARAAEAGAETIMAPHDAFWGDRYARVRDPYGHAWSFAHHLEPAAE